MKQSFHKIADTLVLNADMNPVCLLPVSTDTWQNAIKMVYLDHAQVVHEYEDWEVHSPSVTIRVPSVIMIHEYIHFEKSIPWNDELLLLRDDYKCQYCLKVFPAQQLTQDHVKPRRDGGKTTWDNIVAACAPCNHRKGHNAKVVPKKMPYKPSYWELVKKAQQHFPLVIPDHSWVDYLQWPQENLFVRGEEKKILRMSMVA